MIPTIVIEHSAESFNSWPRFQNPEGWGCDSHEIVAEELGMSLPITFQNPEGWGCDSHVDLTQIADPADGSLLFSFRIPKDGGVIPTVARMKELARYFASAKFQNPEGWGCDSQEALEAARERYFELEEVSESRRMGV